MKVNDVVFDENTFGITQLSLQMLRDTLARAVDQRIAVFEIQTSDLCCGYLILNRDTGIATFTGDGFRLDRSGEGGAGHRAAEILFSLFGVHPFPYDEMVHMDAIYRGDKFFTGRKLLAMARNIGRMAGEVRFVKLSERRPQYVR